MGAASSRSLRPAFVYLTIACQYKPALFAPGAKGWDEFWGFLSPWTSYQPLPPPHTSFVLSSTPRSAKLLFSELFHVKAQLSCFPLLLVSLDVMCFDASDRPHRPSLAEASRTICVGKMSSSYGSITIMRKREAKRQTSNHNARGTGNWRTRLLTYPHLGYSKCAETAFSLAHGELGYTASARSDRSARQPDSWDGWMVWGGVERSPPLLLTSLAPFCGVRPNSSSARLNAVPWACFSSGPRFCADCVYHITSMQVSPCLSGHIDPWKL